MMTMRIGIVTVRDPEYHPNRRLLEAARRLGHDAFLIHPYRLWPATIGGRLGAVSAAAPPMPHVVLPRQGAQVTDACLNLIRHFQLTGVPLINNLAAVATVRNKFLTQQVLTAADLLCPDTVLINDAAGFLHAVDRLGGYPVVVKPVNQRQGQGVLRIDSLEDARRRALPAVDPQRGLMVQCYVAPERRRDIRALIIDNQLVCAVTLTPPRGDFRANVHLGSAIRPIMLPSALERIAVRAAAAVGCDVAGVDMMVAADSRPLIAEVNYAPGFKGLESATGMDIAGRIIGLAAQRSRQVKSGGTGL